MAKRADRERRIGILLPVEFERLGQRVTGMAGNISRHGIYVRTETFMPVAEIVELGISLPKGMMVRVVARAVHSLERGTAHSLGRYAGIGFSFIDQGTPALEAIAEMIEEIAGEVSAPLCDKPVRLVIAHGDPRMLDRMATVLGEAGYAVEAHSNGVEAYAACLQQPPEIVLASENMPIMDGNALAAQIAQEKLDVNVLFVNRPFTDEELCGQIARIIGERRARPALRANLREMSLGALLSFLEQGRKTGTVTALRGDVLIELRVRDGRIVYVTGPGDDPRLRLLDLLDWTEGVFEFHAGPVQEEDHVQWSTSKLLFEHARTRDELMEQDTAVEILAI
jgi:CheY-like chemotaxis protein